MHLRLFRLVIALCFCGAASSVLAQSPVRRAPRRHVRTSYIFVSPNSQNSYSFDQAVAQLDSADELALIAGAQRLDRCLGIAATTQPAIGSWREGTEPSSVSRESVTRAVLHYQAARLGARWQQESVLIFRARKHGPHRMYVLRPRRDLDFAPMAAAMERAGIAYRTLVRERSGRSVVYVVEMSHDLMGLIQQAQREMDAQLTTFEGDGQFFGAIDRARAQELFRREVQRFELKYPGVRERCR